MCFELLVVASLSLYLSQLYSNCQSTFREKFIWNFSPIHQQKKCLNKISKKCTGSSKDILFPFSRNASKAVFPQVLNSNLWIGVFLWNFLQNKMCGVSFENTGCGSNTSLIGKKHGCIFLQSSGASQNQSISTLFFLRLPKPGANLG